MAIVIEDGSIVSGANSYVTEIELEDYAAARGYTLLEDAAILIVKSMDYTEVQPFGGFKYTADQPLQFPRENLKIDGYLIAVDVIPNELKIAQMATAIAIDQGYDPMAAIERAVKSERVDVIEVVYQDNSAATPISRTITMAFAKLLGGGNIGYNFKVSHA